MKTMSGSEGIRAQLRECVYRHVVDNYQFGFLHHSIYIILKDDPALADRLCQEFNIDRKNRLERDLELLDSLNLYWIREEKTPFDHAANLANDLASNFGLSGNGQEDNNSEVKKMENIEKVIFGACTLTGIFIAVYGLNNLSKKQGRREEEARMARSMISGELSTTGETKYTGSVDNRLIHTPIRAELCLIVAAKEVSNRASEESLSVEEVRHLLENSPYFRCTTFTEAKESENGIAYSDDPILPDSSREVYVRIEIDRGGRELIDKKFPYIVSTNIPEDAVCTIKKIGCLKDLTGLEKFETV